MRHGIVLFACDRGITPAEAAKAAEERGFEAFYVPEHTHIPVKREAAHPRSGDGTLPDDRYKRTLREYVEAMRALWTQEEAAYDGEFVKFGPCWAFPKPVQAHVPLIIGAGGGSKTFGWIARHADGWMTTPGEQDIRRQGHRRLAGRLAI